MEGQCVYLLIGINWQLHYHLNHTLGNRWVVNRVNILRLLVQVFIKVHSHGLLAIDSHVVNQATLIQEVES